MRAVVMGGTGGIGLATAKRLTEEGIEVTITGRNHARLDELRHRFASAELVDGTDRAAVTAFFERFGAFEHLVLSFSPGQTGRGHIREVPFEHIETAFAGKLFAYVHAIREAHVTGSITLLSGVTARAKVPGSAALAGVNGAIERMVPLLAAELAPIRVNVVSPGVVDTPLWSVLKDDEREARFKSIAASTPAGRVANANDVAKAIRYLVDAEFITGSIMVVDGGFTVA